MYLFGFIVILTNCHYLKNFLRHIDILKKLILFCSRILKKYKKNMLVKTVTLGASESEISNVEVRGTIRDLFLTCNKQVHHGALISIEIRTNDEEKDRTICNRVPLVDLCEIQAQIAGEGHYSNSDDGFYGKIGIGNIGNFNLLEGETLYIDIQGVPSDSVFKFYRNQNHLNDTKSFIYKKSSIKALSGGTSEDVDCRGVDMLVVAKFGLLELKYDYKPTMVNGTLQVPQSVIKPTEELEMEMLFKNDFVKLNDSMDSVKLGSDKIFAIDTKDIERIHIRTDGNEVLYYKISIQ